MLAIEASSDRNIQQISSDAFLDGETLIPSQVALILRDPIRTGYLLDQQTMVRAKLTTLGFSQQGLSKNIGEYDNLSLRERLGLVAKHGQYTVELWSSTSAE